MFADFFHVIVFFVAIACLVWVPLFIGKLIRPQFPGRKKQDVYECGEPTIGSSWVRYNIRFYQTALIFLLFDVELVFLIPVVLWLRPAATGAAEGAVSASVPWLVFLEIGVFVAVLTVGLAYAWRFGGLNWISGVDDMSNDDVTPEHDLNPETTVVAAEPGVPQALAVGHTE